MTTATATRPDLQDSWDARGVANLLIERATLRGISISNLSLQKLVYFAHGLMLTRHGRPLVDGYFEAWEHGPVHPLLYETFKGHGRAAITAAATSRDFRTNSYKVVPAPSDIDSVDVIDEVLRAYGGRSPGYLVHLSHSKGGPWDAVANENGTQSGLGLRITDIIILERFNRHKMMVDAKQAIGDDAFDEEPPA